MGYFDGLTDALFKKDEAGTNFFYPWGVLASGYELESEAQKNQIRQFVKQWYIFSLPAVILSQALISTGLAAILALVALVWYFAGLKKLTKDLKKSHVKLKLLESY